MLDTLLLQCAINKAWEYQTLALPNPSVGVLLYAPQYGIISLQAHQKAGAPHAEVLAFAYGAHKLFTHQGKLDLITHLDSLLSLPLTQQSEALHTFLSQNAQGLFQDCTLYVTLEPCTHFGKTPPCVELTKAMRPKRVVIGTSDPHTQASGGTKTLQQAGIEVVCGICEEAAQALLYPFVCWQHNGYFRLFKLAMRINGDYTSGQISQKATQIFTHNQRSVSDTIIVSGETFRTDMPRLDSRFATPPYDSTHTPNVEILTRSALTPTINPHFASRPAKICHSPDSLDTHRGFCIIEGGFGLLATLQQDIDIVLLHIAPNFYPNALPHASSNATHDTLYTLNLLHTTSHTGDISLWFKNP
ncbi:MAG: bifunctional diaminohydroxyphosphoribosylaminopyrimidine deaminase/5-amino-6-(5-phosphoribosylamino)uracil reductase RibD [Helicobacter sp.]|nr:bifunctional diaminohydroxyphosphoribosylaminopyrimidine deaminase/5-amino-6-(5-phosphoribosylamino)uracil reductase RibD [Helicobacter sp.]